MKWMVGSIMDGSSTLSVIVAPLCLFTLATESVSVRAEVAKPNIILCMADDQGWGDVGYTGHPVLKTPNLDAMATEALRFNRFYAAAPVCSPTRSNIMTNRHPNHFKYFQ